MSYIVILMSFTAISPSIGYVCQKGNSINNIYMKKLKKQSAFQDFQKKF
jgi:hypothetical protein